MAALRRFFLSAGVRLAVVYAALFGVSALLLILVLWSAPHPPARSAG